MDLHHTLKFIYNVGWIYTCDNSVNCNELIFTPTVIGLENKLVLTLLHFHEVLKLDYFYCGAAV